MAKIARVYDGSAWVDLASSNTDLSSYSTTSQVNTAITDAVSAVPAGGLTLINTATFTSVSAVQIDNCFTNTYDNYFVAVTIPTCSAGNVTIQSRLVDGTTPSSAGSYGYFAAGIQNNGAANNLNALSQTSWRFAHGDVGFGNGISLHVFNPQKATRTFATFNSVNANGSFAFSYAGAAIFEAATQFEGIQFFPASGNFTGTISVYGLAK